MESKNKSNNFFKISDRLYDICKKIEDVNRFAYKNTDIKETDELSEYVKKDVDEGMYKLYNLYRKYVSLKDLSREKIPTFSNFADYIISKFFSKTYGIKELLAQNKNQNRGPYQKYNIDININVPKEINNNDNKKKQDNKNQNISRYQKYNIDINRNVPKEINNEENKEKINTRHINGEDDEMSK